MRKWIGFTCLLLGALCILTAIGFVVYNRWEEQNAADTAHQLLEDMQDILGDEGAAQPLPDNGGGVPTEMATIKVDGYDCIGILSLPALDVELPVLKDWSYAKLKKAPCHYYGSYYEKDFVIAAHNYASHFGRLSELQAGDAVVFTDVHGVKYPYRVVLSETLPENATEEMIASGFDLSLYTCTTGGSARVTLRCAAVENGG